MPTSSSADGGAQAAEAVFLEALEWLKENYVSFGFFVERDMVWTLQKKIRETLQTRRLHLDVHHNHTLSRKGRLAQAADIALLSKEGLVLLAAEFKFEPCHKRLDILEGKFPVVFWNMVAKDIERIRAFVGTGRAVIAHAIFIDEGGHYRHREALPGSVWEAWGIREDGGPFVLRSRAVSGSLAQPASTPPPAAGSP